MTVKPSLKPGWYGLVAVPARGVLGRMPLIAGDALNNARGALDLATWEVFLACGGDLTDKRARKVYFPIVDDPTKWDSQRADKLPGVASDFVTVIERAQPCFRTDPGGVALTDLAHFNNADKHRTLHAMGMLTGAKGQVRMSGIPPGVSVEWDHDTRRRPVDNTEMVRWRLRAADPGRTIAEILGPGPQTDVKVEWNSALTISLSDGERVCTHIGLIIAEVETIIRAIDEALSRHTSSLG